VRATRATMLVPSRVLELSAEAVPSHSAVRQDRYEVSQWSGGRLLHEEVPRRPRFACPPSVQETRGAGMKTSRPRNSLDVGLGWESPRKHVVTLWLADRARTPAHGSEHGAGWLNLIPKPSATVRIVAGARGVRRWSERLIGSLPSRSNSGATRHRTVDWAVSFASPARCEVAEAT
jgi:hypothetical protein